MRASLLLCLIAGLAWAQAPMMPGQSSGNSRTEPVVTIGGRRYTPQQSSDIVRARDFLNRAATAARVIPDDPPRPPGEPPAYYDPPYGPEKREQSLSKIAEADTDAGELSTAIQIAKLLGSGNAKDSLIEYLYVAGFSTGTSTFALGAIARSPLTQEAKQSLLRQVALARARAGDVQGSLDFDRALGNAGADGEVLSAIAVAQAKAGDISGAMKTGMAIPHTPDNALAAIRSRLALAVAQEKARDHSSAQNSIATVIQFISDTPALSSDPSVRGMVVDAQIEAGLIDGALATARSIPLNPTRNVGLVHVAVAQARQGDIKGAFATVRGIQEMDGDLWRARSLAEIGKAQAARGDKAGARESFVRSIQAAASLKSPILASIRAQLLAKIARAEAQAGENAASRATFVQADREARTVLASHGALALSVLATQEAQAGFVKEALQTASAIRAPEGTAREQAWPLIGAFPQDTLFEIARFQGLRGEPSQALDWIDKLNSPDLRASALLGFANGLLERAGAEPNKDSITEMELGPGASDP